MTAPEREALVKALLPCPFCGGKAEHKLIETYSTDSSYYVVKCAECQAMIETNSELHPDDVKAWNARVTRPNAPAVTVTEGWKLVPIEPTDAMVCDGECAWLNIWRGGKAVRQQIIRAIYKMMVAFAPSAPASPRKSERDAVLEEAAKAADDWLSMFGAHQPVMIDAQTWACDAVSDIAEAIRALKSTTPQTGSI